jgi:polynucleotide 5'-hydroxyl-kinase GRC3/NOL9
MLSHDEDPRIGCHPTVSLPEWNELLSISASEKSRTGKTSITVICGPKSSGKSTFSRLLTNRLLTSSTHQRIDSSIAFLDLDPGQPEFSPPGQISLILLSKPNLGPPYSHPDGSRGGCRIIRAHSIAAVSPSSDPAFYLTCATDLLSCYRNMLSPVRVPLVINTPGWILGTGLELLINLIERAQPTQIIYMSEDGPQDVVESLQDAAKSITVVTLPSQPIEYLSRTGAHLRTMQYMSYFHLSPRSMQDPIWDPDPITSMAPLEVKYGGKASGILGVMCLGEHPPARMVRDTIDGAVVAIVVIEDMAAIHGSRGSEIVGVNSYDQSTEDTPKYMYDGNEEVVKLHPAEDFRQLEKPLIFETPEGIPYFSPENGASLDPTYSHTIGLAIVRGIDVKRRRLQLLTPISAEIVGDIRASGKKIILVSGNLDTPGWAYLEVLYKRSASTTEVKKQRRLVETAHESGDEETDAQLVSCLGDHGNVFEDEPWVEILPGDKGRDAGSQVWRVRRDLGKTGQGA